MTHEKKNIKDRKAPKLAVGDLEPSADPKGGPTVMYMTINDTGFVARTGVGAEYTTSFSHRTM